MSRFGGSIPRSGNAMAATTTETVVQAVAAANHRVVLNGYGMAGRGTSNTDEPGLVEVLRQTTAGTSSAATVVKKDDSLAETLQTTGRDSFTAEPTAGDILRAGTLHPQSSMDLRDPFAGELIIGGGDRIGIRGTFQQAQTVDAYLDFEE